METFVSIIHIMSQEVTAYMKSTPHVKTPEEVRAHFDRIGKPITIWAREHGYTPTLVYEILHGRILCKRGKSHEVAVLLGLKDGEIEHRYVP